MNNILLGVSIVVLVLLSSCGEECEEQLRIGEELIAFAVVDKSTGLNIIKKGSLSDENRFLVDSVRIFDENHEELIHHRLLKEYWSSMQGYAFFIYIFNNRVLLSDQDPYEPGTRTYYVRFSAEETDTLFLSYDYDNLECGYTNNYYEIFLNGKPMERSTHPDYEDIHIMPK